MYTPPTLNVSSRMAHGLSLEGCSISKYFLLEMIFLLLGYLTFVPEIQEFCSFAFIGLVVDMYMQVIFYYSWSVQQNPRPFRVSVIFLRSLLDTWLAQIGHWRKAKVFTHAFQHRSEAIEKLPGPDVSSVIFMLTALHRKQYFSLEIKAYTKFSSTYFRYNFLKFK